MNELKNTFELTHYSNWPQEINANPKPIPLKKNNKIGLISFASYLAMYHPSLSDFLIERYSKKNDLIFDPFSGRGTTLYSARLLKRRFVATDLNPYSYILSKARAKIFDVDKCLEKITEWKTMFLKHQKTYLQKIHESKFEDIRNYYSNSTLAQLIFFQEKYGKNWKKLDNNATFLLALLAGIMHGPMRKDGTTIYLSVSMPNWVSMAPNYVKKYVKKHQLIKPDVDIFDQLKARFLKYAKYNLNNLIEGDVFLHDASKPFNNINNNSIDLTVTSPPYLNIVNYTGNNWLKLWLLGFERKQLSKQIKLADNLKIKEYKAFMIKFLNNLYPKMKSKARVCLVVGDVHDKNLIKIVWDEIKNQVQFKFDSLFHYHNHKNRKHSNSLNIKKGRATKIEKILVLRKL